MALDEQFMVKLVNDTISNINNRKLNEYKEPILEYINANKIGKSQFLKLKQNSFTKNLKGHLKKKSIDLELIKLYNFLNAHFEPIITVGDTIQIDIKNTKNNIGIIRFVGEIQGRKGTFFGIELNTPNGTSNGTLDHIEYFKTKNKYAIFIKKKGHEMKILQNGENFRTTVGEIVYIEKVSCNAVIRFVGNLHFKKDNKTWYGVQLEQAKGKNNGTVKDRRYFRCQQKYGLFLKPNDITIIDRNAKYFQHIQLDSDINQPIDSDIEADISYASSADFAEYDYNDQRIHFFVMDKDKINEFNEPIFATDIDTNDDRYVGISERQIDISENLKKLKLDQNNCEVLAFKEINVNEQCVLERVYDYKYFNETEEMDEKLNMDDVKENYNGLHTICEENDGFKMVDFELLKKKSHIVMDKTNEMKALRMKYSSRRVILHGKNKSKQPKCSECNTYYHIQSDPLNAYDGVGIVCEICGKNRNDNPELILEDTFYTCEGCGGIDICKTCYMVQKKALKQQFMK